MIQRLACGGVIVLAACGPAPTPEPPAPAPASATPVAAPVAAPAAAASTPADREAAFAELERRLLEARDVRLDFQVTATGAVEAEIRGDLAMDGDGRIELAAAGEFAGRPVDLIIRTSGDRYVYGRAAEPVESDRPDQLREALLIGLTRMGILHNIARLSGGAPPDRAEGGVTEWVEVENFGLDPADPDAMVFGLRVSGRPAGSAVLVPGPDGLPRLRRQTVRFPEGEMRVVERYSAVVVEP